MTDFAYQPNQYVRVKLFGLNYCGRIVRCIRDADSNMYSVQYAKEGDIRRDEFYEDEIEAECL